MCNQCNVRFNYHPPRWTQVFLRLKTLTENLYANIETSGRHQPTEFQQLLRAIQFSPAAGNVDVMDRVNGAINAASGNIDELKLAAHEFHGEIRHCGVSNVQQSDRKTTIGVEAR